MARSRRRSRAATSGDFTDSWLFKAGTKLVLTVIVIMLFLTFIQCTVKKPESPTWTTQFTVPLLNRTYPMSELVEKIDQDGIQYDGDSNIVYTITRELDTVHLDDDQLTTGDLSYNLTQQLGEVDIDAPSIAPVSLALTEITGLAAFVPGEIPAMDFNIINALPTIGNFSSASISNGQALVVVNNSLGFNLPAVSVELYDLGNARSLGTHVFPAGIATAETDTATYNLAGQTISNSLEARISASTYTVTVLSTANKQITTGLFFPSDITVSSATAQVPAMERQSTEYVTLGEADAVYRAPLTSGSLQIDVDNQSNLSANVEIIFPDVTHLGTPLTVNRTINAQGTTQVSVDLTGYDLIPTDSTLPQQLAVDVNATFPGSGVAQVAVDENDGFYVTAGLSDLRFGSVRGVFSAVTTTVDPRHEEIDVPKGFDSLQLVSAVLTLEIENAVNLPGSLDITLHGDNGKTLNLTGTIAAGETDSAVTSVIVNTEVADFLSPVPSNIDITGSATFGDGVSESIVDGDDYIFGSINIVAPIEVVIPRTPIEADIEGNNVNQDDIDVVTDHVIEGRLVYNIINHLPIGASVNLYLSGDSATVMTNPQVSFVGDIFVTAAPTTGSIATDTVSTGYQYLVIDSTDVQVLKNDTLYVGTEIILEDSNGQPVKLTNSDYLRVIGRIEVEYRFDGEF